jgi:hypothetical protein
MLTVSLRDEIENTLVAWDRYERARGAAQIIDYDCRPVRNGEQAASSRLDVFERLNELHATCSARGPIRVVERVESDLTYLRAMMGERIPISEYVRRTQGCNAAGWPTLYILERGELAREALSRINVGWDESTRTELSKQETPLDLDQAQTAIRSTAKEFEPAVRELAGSDAPYSLTIETTDVDAYWAYWLDGAGEQARLRLNLRHAQFSDIQARIFALHEVLGHGLQGATYSDLWAKDDVPWVRLLSVHASQQVLLEGLAQALPLFVCPDDEQLVARVRLTHYIQLVRSELHLAINSGWTVERCTELARSRIPFLNPAIVPDLLTDRSVNPQLRSYLWSYPAGIDWFVRLAEEGGSATTDVLHAAYREPLSPGDLQALWPSGPIIGGSGVSVASPST